MDGENIIMGVRERFGLSRWQTNDDKTYKTTMETNANEFLVCRIRKQKLTGFFA